MSEQSRSETETLEQPGTATMKAVRIHAFGGNENLRYEDVAIPEPKAGEVLVKVEAASVNPADYKMASGKFGPMPLPLTLGLDYSGTVAALGEGASKWKLGDAVFGTLLGSFAEYRVAPQDQLAAKPDGLGHTRAATLPVAALTAWNALFETAGLQAGQKALIHAGAGGVGGFAVQLAKQRGIYVAATASARNQAYLKELGADLAIDYSRDRFEDLVRDADMVFDTVGGETQARSYRALRKGGILVSIVQPPSQEEAAKHGVRAQIMMNRMDPKALERIGDLAAEGKLRIEIAEELPLAEIRRAFESIQGGHTRGKIALRVA